MSSLSVGNSATVYSKLALVGTAVDVSTNVNHLIHSIAVFNNTGAIAHLQVFDKQSGNVTPGSTAPTFTLTNPASATNQWVFDPPVRFTVGFSIISTTTATGATGASQDVAITYAAA